MNSESHMISEIAIKNAVDKSVKKFLREAKKISEYENNGHTLSVIDYDMGNEDDKEYILNHKNEIWNILQQGYESKGGFKGFQSIRDMIKKSPFYKLGYYDGEIITVSVYNDYLGGSKCVGVACVKDDRHTDSIHLLKLIIENNIQDFDRWIWVEVSGKVEEMCKEAGAFNVPNKYTDLYLTYIPFKVVKEDEYHYERNIGGNKEIKTIFGFNNRDSFELIKNELNKEITSYLQKFNININEDKNPENQTLFNQYMSKRHPVYKFKGVVDYFVYLKDDELCNEFTVEMRDILQKSINQIKNYLNDKSLSDRELYIMNLAIEEGERVLSTTIILKPIDLGLAG